VSKDNISDLAAELYELESEAAFLRRKLGCEICADHSAVFKSFLNIHSRIKMIKHALMLYGRIP